MARRSHSGTIKLAWGVRLEGRSLWSRNAVRGQRHRRERLKKDGRNEWRQWPVHTSKLGAGLLRTRADPARLLPESGDSVLYLGAGHGTTIAHLHDHLCGADNHHGGRIVAVDISPRCIRDLIGLAASRPGIIPVCADARQTASVAPFVSRRVRWLFQDVSQAGQAEMMVAACRRFLSPGGLALLSLKAASERRIDGGEEIRYTATETTLTSAGLSLDERIDLTGLEEKHALFVLRAPPEWP